MSTRLFRNTAIICIFLLAVISLSAAQGTTSLHGTISDQQSSVIAGATVILEDAQRGLTLQTESNTSGFYELLQVPPGTYRLTVSAKGFKALLGEELVLRVASPTTFNAMLSVGAATESVEVHASDVPVINSTDATLGNNFDSKQVLLLPSEGRNPVELLSLQPGVTYTGNQVDQSTDSRGGSVNGARSDQTNLTVDGLDNNDQLQGQAFSGVLRIPSESIEEFRVITSSSNADAGRSSGAQVALSTKSGTNAFHGSLYEYNRSALGEANDWFNKRAQLANGEPNKPGQLIRNTFGGAIGGPMLKNRLYFFLNYEGQRSREAAQVTETVPSDALRQGILQYYCDSSDPNCTSGNSVVNVTEVGGQMVASLTPANLAALDQGCSNPTPPLVVTCPLGSGVNPAVLALWNGQATLPNGTKVPAYPHPNTNSGGGDGLNIQGYTFAAPQPNDQNTYLARIDYNLTANGNHRLFVRGNAMNDRFLWAPLFPGQSAPASWTDHSKGLFVGYTAVITPHVVNNFRYGYVRQSNGTQGQNPYSHFGMWGMSDQVSFWRTTDVTVPAHQFVDDLTWIRGKHTWQFGGNWRRITNNRLSDAQNYFSASPVPSNLAPYGAIAGSGLDLDPGSLASSGYPSVSSWFGGSYDGAVSDLTGIIGAMSAVYMQDKSGPIPTATLVPRHFKTNEFEFYGQDTWHVATNLTLTLGLRYTLLQPPYETSGNQVLPDPQLGDFFQARAAAMNEGKTYDPTISFILGGPANGKPSYWRWDYRDVAPRIAFAWSPSYHNRFTHWFTGNPGQSSLRGGFGMYYDHFGQGIVNTFDRQGSLGLTTWLQNPGYVEYPSCAARFVSLTTIPNTLACPLVPGGAPQSELPSPPTYGFPFVAPGEGQNGAFAVGWGVDNRVKTPYVYSFDLAYSRELAKNFSVEISYNGRLGHRLMQELDLAQPLNIRDPQSGMTYYQAAQMLQKSAAANIPENQIQPIPYWENLFPTAGGPAGISGAATGIPANPTATQNMYDLFQWYGVQGIGALQSFDAYCFPGCSQVVGQSSPQTYNFFDPQFSTMFSWSSIGYAYYHGLLVTLRRHVGNAQFDLNYTYSHSIDMNSNAERISMYEGGWSAVSRSGQTINAWMPYQLRSSSDFDLRHQINFNWLYSLPFGRGQRFANGSGKVLNLFVGGWQLSGIGRWTSGFPFSVATFAYPTNWWQDSRAFLTGHVSTGSYTDVNGQPNVFKESTIGADTLASQFRYAYVGESGQRNNLRGPGYFGIDASLGKTFHIA
ncbi:MAG TPA: TonB-dependent receptor, partial [Dongiaceae bacterium]|nr:TonB-dependent receptor [Dongiaceae bacterium]